MDVQNRKQLGFWITLEMVFSANQLTDCLQNKWYSKDTHLNTTSKKQ